MIAALYHQLMARIRAFNPSPRERVMLAAMAFVVASVVLSACYDWTNSAYERASRAHAARGDAQREFAQLTDRRARERIGLAAGNVWAWSITEPSISIGQVRAVSEVQDLATSAGMSDANVEQVAQQDAARGPNGFRSIDVRVAASFEWRTFEAFLGMLRQSSLSLTPISVDVATSNGQSRVVMIVRASFLPEAAT
ncbi:MAG: hypothetical protein QM759_05265 [Terricaulis sp.]